MKRIDQAWKCSPGDVVEENSPEVAFCGICIQKTTKGIYVHQRPYTNDLLKKHQMDGCTSTKILLDKETEEDKENQSEPSTEVKIEDAREAQKIAGEILWLSTRSRPDLSYPIQKMTSEAQGNPKKAIKIGTRILRYLKGTKDFGLFYPNE